MLGPAAVRASASPSQEPKKPASGRIAGFFEDELLRIK
jgi:hypothetical protein